MKWRPQIASVVGVDAGGSKTRAAYADGDAIVRTADGATANPTLIGVADAADEILRTVRRAAGGNDFDGLYVGAAGAGSPAVAEELAELLRAAFPSARLAVGDDATIALRGAIPDGPGAAIVAGTGSIAIAVDAGGAVHRAGGLGFLLGDEGSAAWIGIESLRRLGRVFDGRDHDEETSRLVARHLGVADRAALIRTIYGERVDVPRIAAIAPAIVAFAGKGNRVSRAIVDRASAALAELVISVAGTAKLERDGLRVAFCGGLLREENYLTGRLQSEIQSVFPHAQTIRSGDPLDGAVRCARALLLC